MNNKLDKQDILDYHALGRPGKIEVIPSKPSNSQNDLAIAYSPGVAVPCMEIHNDVNDVYKYTAKGNLVAVISNGTAVLGLGDIGPEASKPVMEGKGLLFKIFADIDVFDLELNVKDPEQFIQTVKALEPTFGGINLEDIKAPDCFVIEKRLKEELNIPIMHDDQHGTAIITGAALLNALELVKKEIAKIKVVVNGAGASAISCARLFIALGVSKENLIMLDSKGVLRSDRTDLDENKLEFQTDAQLNTLEEAFVDADVFMGLSKGNIVNKEMLQSMAENPIVFALANPDPEIPYNEAIAARKDVIVATGRSDHPNQVNNVLGFPYIFRGALDVRASKINEEMKLAAVYAIADLAKKPVPEIVNMAYNQKNITFGRDYLIPKPFDPRLIYTVAPSVAKAAMDSGVAKFPIKDWDIYKQELIARLGLDDKFLSFINQKAKQNPKRVVFCEADTFKILKAAATVYADGVAIPILLGDEEKIHAIAKEHQINLDGLVIINPMKADNQLEEYAQSYYQLRNRKGVTLYDARKIMRDRNYFGSIMVEKGAADAMISGLTRNYPQTIVPALQIIGKAEETEKISGMYIMLTKKGPLFFGDTTVSVNPSAEEIMEITSGITRVVKTFNIEPSVALLSFSNFGSNKGDVPTKMQKARKLLKEKFPNLIVDGDIQANFALNQNLLKENYPFSDLVNHPPNTFIFPDLAAGNIAYKMLQSFGAAEAVGPILLGMRKPVHVLQLGSSVREIINMVAIAVIDAQIAESK